MRLIGYPVVFMLALWILAWGKTAPAGTKLELGDCMKCHPDVVDQVTRSGSSHKTAVSCLDCHREHPPLGAGAIPECSQCHSPDGTPHFALRQCASCHPPHAPLQIDFSRFGEVRPVCLSCHPSQGEEMRDYPSLHADPDCTFCHPVHQEATGCLDCHDPHSSGMTYQDCLQCHKPHQPTLVRYGETIPSAFCTGCHEAPAEALRTSDTRHSQYPCAFCHKMQHRMIPECQACHGQPHNPKMMVQFKDCLECHLDAHALAK